MQSGIVALLNESEHAVNSDLRATRATGLSKAQLDDTWKEPTTRGLTASVTA